MSNDAHKEKLYNYYLWLDEMIVEHWSEYIDLVVSEGPTQECNNKIKVIEFYQKELEIISQKVSFAEAYEWRQKRKIKNPIQKVCDSLFPDDT